MFKLLGSCLGLISGKPWKALRRVTEAPFTIKQTTSYVDLVEGHAKDHIASLVGDDISKPLQIKPYADLRVCTQASFKTHFHDVR